MEYIKNSFIFWYKDTNKNINVCFVLHNFIRDEQQTDQLSEFKT